MDVQYGYTPPKFSKMLRQRIGAVRPPAVHPRYYLTPIAAAARAMIQISAQEWRITKNLTSQPEGAHHE